MATKDEIDNVLALLIAAYPYMQKDKGIDMRPTLIVYHRTLADIDGASLLAAALDHISRDEYFPTVNALRDAAYRVVTLNQPTAEEAWGEVKSELKRAGHTKTPVFSHELIERTIKAMGWIDLCQSDIDNEPADRAHFMRIYNSMAQRQKDNAMMLPELRNLTQRLSAANVKELEAGR